MAVNYDEKILSRIGSRTDNKLNEEIKNGIFVVDPNKIVTEDYSGQYIKDRYVKQEDMVMYANITARMAPDNHILENGNGDSDIVVSLGQIGVNFLNPYSQAPRDEKSGKIIFGDKKFKDKFTTEWSDYFTSNAEQGTFFDPETFGISNIDVTHNASLTPIIKAEFIDVQGRTLLERGNDPENPYNIFYRFPYPLFTLTIKGYFGKAIEYPLVMTKTSTTFDANTGNYVIRAEFLSKTFSLYNNFLMFYSYVAPYMYKDPDKENTFLGRKLLRALYDKQNKEYEKIYGADSPEYKKRQIDGAPTLIDLARGQEELNISELQFGESLNQLNEKRQKAISIISDLESSLKQNQITELKNWKKFLRYDDSDRNLKKYFLSEDYTSRLIKNDWLDLKERTFQSSGAPFTPYNIYGGEYKKNFDKISELSEDGGQDIITVILNKIKLAVLDRRLPEGYLTALSLRNITKPSEFLVEEIILFNYTSSRNPDDVNLIYYTDKYLQELNKIVTSELSTLYSNNESDLIDGLSFNLKEKLGFVPNMTNVVRILMNNMQVFLSLLNLVALNSYRQIERDEKRRVNQQTFGEYGVTDYSDDKIFYPFPNYYEKVVDPLTGNSTWKKTYPGDDKNIGWFEVQFVEEMFRAMEHMKSQQGEGKKHMDKTPVDGAEFIEKVLTQSSTTELNKMALSSSLLVMNNLDYYNDAQTQSETISEFIEKILLYASNSFVHKSGDVSKINAIVKKLVDNEFSLLNKKQYNKDAGDVKKFYDGIKFRVEELGIKKGYDVFLETFVGGTETSDAIISTNQSTITKIKDIINTQNYDPATLAGYYSDLLNNIGANGISVDRYSRLYRYDALEYSGRKSNTTTTPVRALFFNGLQKHEQYTPNDQLKDISVTIEGYLKSNPEPSTGPGYMIYEGIGDYIKKDFPKFNINEVVTSNQKTINGLTPTLKTDKIFNSKTFFDSEKRQEEVLVLDNTKKINDNTTYSKVRI
jgi:hypothetical protein